METLNIDVLIIGSGAAGLRAAIQAREKGLEVAVMSKGSPGKGTCTILSGGVFAGTSNAESAADHLRQTLLCGRSMNQRDLVEILVEEGPQRLAQLVEWGIKGRYHDGDLISEGRAPIWGEEIINCLLRRARTMEVRFLSGLLATEMKCAKGLWGVLAYSSGSDKWLTIKAQAVVLAAGGAGGVYLRHDNPKCMLGDGYCLALRAGAVLRDMEFVQFYPLGLAEPGCPPFLIPPRLADCGRLYNARDEDLYEKYAIQERPAGIRARDRLSQALFRETVRNGLDVRLDLRDVTDAQWNIDPFSASTRHILGERYGARYRPIKILPLTHHVMGGVCADAKGATSMPGLFAAGEVCGGLHGANRMGGNALTETVVFGARAGQAAAEWAGNIRHDGEGSPGWMDNIFETTLRNSHGATDQKAPRLLAELRHTMWQEGGILRNHSGLSRALDRVKTLSDQANDLPLQGDPRQVRQNLELRVAVQTAELILQGALRRQESRGAHFREDFPHPDDEAWCGHLQVQLKPEGGLDWAYQAI